MSLTPCVAKVAEGFIVDDYLKPAVMNVIDDSQYGAIPNSSTTMALISMLHDWSLGTDENGATVRTILCDFIDHSILISKLRNACNLPTSIVNWIVNFLSDRSQRIKLGAECFSDRVGLCPLWGTTRYEIRSLVVCLINDQ